MNLGEAESILIQTHEAACLVDCGETDSGPAIMRTLHRQGIRRLNLVVLTHPHADHIGAFQDLARGKPVEQVLDSGYPLGSRIQRKTLEFIRSKHIPYKRARSGQSIRIGQAATMDVLWPPDTYIHGTDSDPNNNSVVLRVNHGKIHLLLVGDLETECEFRLMGTGVNLQADLLKVGHQGSRDASSDAFLGRVKPRIAAISVGKHNSYGHPDPETIARLKRRGISVFRTDMDGDLIFESDGQSIQRMYKQ